MTPVKYGQLECMYVEYLWLSEWGRVFFKWLLVWYGFQRRMTQLPPADREAAVAKMTTHYNQGMQKSIL